MEKSILTSSKFSLIWAWFFIASFFFISSSQAQNISYCDGISIHTDRSYNCGPGLFRIQLQGASQAKQITWNFGDGEKIAPDSIYQYLSKTGFVDVRVKIQWFDNSFCDTTFRKLIEIKPLPVPDFSFTRTLLCNGPDTVSFFCNTKGASSISWIIDGTNYFNAGSQLVHKFASTGKKGFQVVYTDSFGCRGIVQMKDTIDVLEKAQVNFTSSDTNGCTPLKVSFDAFYNLKGQKAKKQYWRLEGIADSIDGLKLSDIEFLQSGEINVSFTVETEKGCTYRIEKKDYLRIGDSMPLLLNKLKPYYCFNEPIILADLNPKTGGKYRWRMPGNVIWQSDSTKSSTIIKIKENGVYHFSVEYEKNGCITRADFADSVMIKTVKADFSSANNFHCEPPLEVNFRNQSVASDTGQMLYYWLFYPAGKMNSPLGSTNETHPKSVFPDFGRYDVRLITIHKASGCSDTLVRKSFVRIDTIRPVIMVRPPVACKNQEVLLFNATQPSTYAGTDSFHWTIYDTDGTTILKESDSAHITFVSQKAGIFKVKLYGGNPSVCNTFATVYDTIEIITPKVQFLNFPENVCSGKPMRLFGASSPDRAKFTHFWEVYNADTSFSFVTKDSFIKLNKPGDYHIKYAIQIDKGCRDSIIKFNAIGINGVQAKLKIDGNTGCLPFAVKPTIVDLENYHKGSSDDDIKIEWTSTPSTGVSIDTRDKFNPEFNFTAVGAYLIRAKLVNSALCDTLILSDTIFAGVDARFDLNDDRVCIGANISAIATSKLRPTSYQWIKGSDDLDLTSLSEPEIKIKSLKEGNYFIRLVAEKNKICYDMFTRYFSVIEVKANFRSLDTLLTCAPVYAQFLSNSKNADELIWNYGDGKPFVTTLPSSGHIYTRNSGWKDGFDVSLIAINYEGCSDTLLKEDFIWVLGPVPNAKLSNYVGCSPLTVQIENRSNDAIRYIVDYGDNKAWDSTIMPENYTYQFTQIFGDTQQYDLRVFAYDSMGCIAKFEPEEKIEVYRSPVAETRIISTSTCSNSDVLLSDISKGTLFSSWQIYLDQDTIYSNSRNWSYAFRSVGDYPISLEAYNHMQCSTKTWDTIHVYPDVKAKINRFDTACYNELLGFSVTAESEGRINSYRWEITLDGSAVKSDTGATGISPFSQAGTYMLKYFVFNEYNCSDTATETIFVEDPAQIPVPQIKYVSIENGKVNLFAEQSNHLRFLAYSVKHNSNEISTSLDINHIDWFDLNFDLSLGKQCYQLLEEDVCGFVKGSVPHCPVILSASSTANFSITLNWTPYEGWNDVVSYAVKRSMDGVNYQFLGNVKADVLTYIDAPLCPGTYYYVVEATNARGFVSKSNWVSTVPMYEAIPQKLDIRDIRVNNNESISIRWDKSTSARHAVYELYKWKENEKPQILIMSDSFYLDAAVEPMQEIYHYQVRDRDVCGVSNQPGYKGNSILIKGSYVEDQSNLSWNDFEQWDLGILKYQLLIEKAEGFVPVSDVMVTEYSDPVIYKDIKGDYCYKVYAVSADVGRDTSISNSICLIGPSRVFIPNAFTPNKDGINDDFKPTMHFVREMPMNEYQKYEFMVFNRWGEKLFKTDDLSKGWDGRANGFEAQAGVYGFALQIYGLDGKTYYKSGQVHLIR